jgi:hypothetical protein
MYRQSNPKIDVYVSGVYQYSTNWSATCKEAKTKHLEKNPTIDEHKVKCVKAKK